jgi:hypothetical protein
MNLFKHNMGKTGGVIGAVFGEFLIGNGFGAQHLIG